MTYEESVVQLLSQPENLPIALEMVKRVEAVRDHLQIEFWHRYRDEMERRLQEAELKHPWETQLRPDKALVNPWALCDVLEKPLSGPDLHLRVTLESGQPKDGSPLYYGVKLSRPQEADSPQRVMVEQLLKQKGFKLNSSDYWPLSFGLDYQLREDTFLVRFVSNPDDVIHEISEIVWSFFVQLREFLESTNIKLANMERMTQPHD